MNQNQMVQALNTENRRLRGIIESMQREHNQGKFLEDLVCAALTGVISSDSGLPVKDAAAASIDYAEAVLHEITTRLNSAQEQETATP